MSEVLEVNDSNFEDEIIKSELPAMVDLWAPWCQPCLTTAPWVEELALWVLLSDGAAADLPPEAAIEPAEISSFWGVKVRLNTPPRKGIEDVVEARLNNAPLGKPTVDGGWLVFYPGASVVAAGENLIGLLIAGTDASLTEITVEKVELRVRQACLGGASA